MAENELIELFGRHNVRPTANRLIIARTLSSAGRPMSLTEIEDLVDTIDKSGIFRTLTLFRDNHLVHVIQDGDSVRYELCQSCSDDDDEDTHVHFHCEKCHRTYCLDEIAIPPVSLPEGYEGRSASYIVTGTCPACSSNAKSSGGTR